MAQEQQSFLDRLKTYFLPRTKQSIYRETGLHPEENNLFNILLKKVFFDAYPGDGVVPLSSKASVNGHNVFKRNVIKEYDLKSGFTSFLGLPNRLREDKRGGSIRKPTSRELLLDLIGWNEDHDFLLFLMPFAALFNIARFCLTTPVSLLKVITEVIPDFLNNLTGIGIHALASKIERWSGIKQGLGIAAGVIAFPALSLVYAVSKLWVGVGMLITSPIKAASMAYALGKSAGGVPGIILGNVFRGVSYLASIVLYMPAVVFLGPVAFQGLGALLPLSMHAALSEGLLFAYLGVKGWLTTTSAMAFGASLAPQTASVLSTGILTAAAATGVRILEEVGEKLGSYFNPQPHRITINYPPKTSRWLDKTARPYRPTNSNTYNRLGQQHPVERYSTTSHRARSGKKVTSNTVHQSRKTSTPEKKNSFIVPPPQREEATNSRALVIVPENRAENIDSETKIKDRITTVAHREENTSMPDVTKGIEKEVISEFTIAVSALKDAKQSCLDFNDGKIELKTHEGNIAKAERKFKKSWTSLALKYHPDRKSDLDAATSKLIMQALIDLREKVDKYFEDGLQEEDLEAVDEFLLTLQKEYNSEYKVALVEEQNEILRKINALLEGYIGKAEDHTAKMEVEIEALGQGFKEIGEKMEGLGKNTEELKIETREIRKKQEELGKEFDEMKKLSYKIEKKEKSIRSKMENELNHEQLKNQEVEAEEQEKILGFS